MNDNTVNIYFAITDEMIEGNGEPLPLNGNGLWKLNTNSFLAFTIATSAGDVVNVLHAQQMHKPYIICKAKVTQNVLVEALRAVLHGDVMRDVVVNVIETIRVK